MNDDVALLEPRAVLPHEPPMVLLSRILSHDARRTVCAVDLTPASPFFTAGRGVPVWVGVEYMAQCVAAHAGLLARARGEAVKIGFLIGARRIDLRARRFEAGQTLVVTANHVWGERELASFSCMLADGRTSNVLADALLSVYSPSDGLVRSRP